MSEITTKQVYAVDGRNFDTLELAEQYVVQRDSIKRIHALLGNDRPDSNGDSYIQRTTDQVSRYIVAAGDWIEEHIGEGVAARWRENPRGIVGRFLDDSGNREAYGLGYRINCIDSRNREWGQPYYASKSNKSAIQVKEDE